MCAEHGGSNLMIWACVAASGPGQFVIIDGAMNYKL